MADVSVEFGAKDVGLEKTLKGIQDEISRLEGSVKSGNLPLEDLKGKMKEIGQLTSMEKRIKAMGDTSDGTAPKVDALGKDIKRAGDSSDKAGSQIQVSFAKMAGAVAVGQAAFEAFKATASMGLSAVTSAIGSLANSFTSAIDAAAEMETLETAFIPLLGSVEAAQARIEELARFAAETPFEMPEIAKASKTLETLTRGALSTADGLRLVGDVASATNAPFEEISVTVGRLYDGLQSGRPVGEVMQRLQELGAVSGETRSQIEALSKEGKNTEAWLVAEEALNRFSGSMKLQSGTWTGLLSTLSDNITQALAKFGEPILDRLKPYLQGTIALVELLADKAVTFGTKFAENFIASSDAAKSFQKAIDAISTGKVEAGFNLFWETLKLQAMQTGNSLYKAFAAAFETVKDSIVSVFGPGSGTFTLVADSFSLAGKMAGRGLAEGVLNALPQVNEGVKKTIDLLAVVLPGIGAPAKLALEGADKALGVLRGSLDGMNQSIEAQKSKLATSYDSFAANAANSFTKIPEGFKENLNSIPPLFDGIAAQQSKVAEAEAALTTQTQATNDARGETIGKLELTGTTTEKIAQAEELLTQAIADGNTELQSRLEKNLQVLQSQAEGEAAAARAKALSLEIVETETALNAAKAAGNEELTKSLEKQLEQKKAKEEIKKLTEEYVKTLGLDADEAARLATNFVNAKNAAASIGARAVSVSITTKVDDTRWKNLLADLAANADPKAVQVALAVTGQDNLKDAYATLQDMETVQKNFTAAFETIGAQSLEEVKANIDGIPTEAQRQLALQLTGEEDFDRAVKKLDSVPLNKNTRLLLESQGFDNVDALQDALKGIPDQKRTKVLLDALGLETVDEAKLALDRILANDGKKAAVAISADTTPAQTAIDSLGDTAQEITLDASNSIEQIKSSLTQEIDLALSSSKGSAYLADIKGFVESIRDLVGKIEPKLPVAALTA